MEPGQWDEMVLVKGCKFEKEFELYDDTDQTQPTDLTGADVQLDLMDDAGNSIILSGVEEGGLEIISATTAPQIKWTIAGSVSDEVAEGRYWGQVLVKFAGETDPECPCEGWVNIKRRGSEI